MATSATCSHLSLGGNFQSCKIVAVKGDSKKAGRGVHPCYISQGTLTFSLTGPKVIFICRHLLSDKLHSVQLTDLIWRGAKKLCQVVHEPNLKIDLLKTNQTNIWKCPQNLSEKSKLSRIVKKSDRSNSDCPIFSICQSSPVHWKRLLHLVDQILIL